MPNVTFDIPQISGEETFFDLNIDPYYYHSSSNNNFIFFCDYNAPIGNANFVFLDNPCSGFDILQGYSGENSYIDLINLNYYSINSGEELNIDLLTFKIFSQITGYSGENTFAILLIEKTFSSNDYSGQELNFDLLLNPPKLFSNDFYGGENASSSLALTYYLASNDYSGEELDFSLSIFPSVNLETIQYYCSQQVYLNSLQIISEFISSVYDGENVFFDLTYIINTGISLDCFDGENVSVILNSTDSLSFLGNGGETGYIDIATTFALYANGNEGSLLTFSLLLNPPDLLSSNNFCGELVNHFNLSTITKLPSLAYNGEILNFTLKDIPGSILSTNNYSGSNSFAILQTSIAIGAFLHYSGQDFIVSTINFDPLWKFSVGENVNSTLSTSFSLPNNIFSGEICEIIFTSKPSEPLGLLTFYSGESCISSLKTLYQTYFYVLFRNSIMTQVDINSATYFDLSTDVCCGERIKSNNLHFIMEKGQFPEEVSYGNRVSLEVNLRTNPRFSVEFPIGNVLFLREKNVTFKIQFNDGSEIKELEFEADLIHRLCKGYFIPTGDWLVVEMNDILLESCYTNRMYSGESLWTTLSDASILLPDDIMTGCYLEIGNLITNPPWIFNAYAGETLTFEFEWNPSSNFKQGELMYIKFYEAPINGFAGESASVELILKYTISFLEEGCFENQFQFQTKDGDLIPELFNPVPVEGDVFKHDILAKCN